MGQKTVLSPEWLNEYADEWNRDKEFVDVLCDVGFTGNVAYGFPDEKEPRFCLTVVDGKASPFDCDKLDSVDWDLRASDGQWASWFESPPGLFALGVAYTGKGLQFQSGDYPSMIKNPPIASSFVQSFVLMSRAYKRIVSRNASAEEKR